MKRLILFTLLLWMLPSQAMAIPLPFLDTYAGSTAGGDFGSGMARDGDVLVVGDPSYPNIATNRGQVTVYRNSATGWSEETNLRPSNDMSSRCGNSVAISGRYIVIGCPGQQRVHVYYEVSSGSWKKVETLTAPSSTSTFDFGIQVGIHNQSIAVSSSSDLFAHKVTATQASDTNSNPATFIREIDSIAKIEVKGSWMVVLQTEILANNDIRYNSLIFKLDATQSAVNIWKQVYQFPQTNLFHLSSINPTANPNIVAVALYGEAEDGVMNLEQTFEIWRVDTTTPTAIATKQGALTQIRTGQFAGLCCSDFQIIGPHLFHGNITTQQLEHYELRPEGLIRRAQYDAPMPSEEFARQIELNNDGVWVSSVDYLNTTNGNVYYIPLDLGPPIQIIYPQPNGELDVDGVISGKTLANQRLKVTLTNMSGPKIENITADADGNWRIPLNQFGPQMNEVNVVVELENMPTIKAQVAFKASTGVSPITMTTPQHLSIVNDSARMLSGTCATNGNAVVVDWVWPDGMSATARDVCVAGKWNVFFDTLTITENTYRIFVHEAPNIEDEISIEFNVDLTPPTLTVTTPTPVGARVEVASPTFTISGECTDANACATVTATFNGSTVPVTLNNNTFTIEINTAIAPNTDNMLELIASDSAGNASAAQTFTVVYTQTSMESLPPSIEEPKEYEIYSMIDLPELKFLLDPTVPSTITLSEVTDNGVEELYSTTLIGDISGSEIEWQINDEDWIASAIYDLTVTTGNSSTGVRFAVADVITVDIDGTAVTGDAPVTTGPTFTIGGKSNCTVCTIEVSLEGQSLQSTTPSADGSWSITVTNATPGTNALLQIDVVLEFMSQDYVIELADVVLDISRQSAYTPEQINESLCSASPAPRPPSMPLLLVLCLVLGYVWQHSTRRPCKAK